MEWAIPEQVDKAVALLKNGGYRAYIVGGAVRDLLMGAEPGDYDIATEALPEQAAELFDKSIPTGVKYGTITAVVDGYEIEITTFRSEGPYEDGRHPSKVQFGVSIEADLARRDFTMNAMALDPVDGLIIDPFEGKEDIGRKIVRAVGDPVERFKEDYLRMLRAVRFAGGLGFSLEENTKSAILQQAEGIAGISAERIQTELNKILLQAKPSVSINLLRETGLLKELIPELLWGYGMEQNKYHAFTVYEHILTATDCVAPRLHLRLAALLHDIGKPKVKKGTHFYGHEIAGAHIAEEILTRLKYPTKMVKSIVHLIRNHMINYSSDWSDVAVRRLVQRISKGSLDDLMELHKADNMAKSGALEISPRYLELAKRINGELSRKTPSVLADLKVTGEDLVSIVGKPGPLVGKVLDMLLDKVVQNPELNDRRTLLEMAKELSHMEDKE